MKNHFEILAVTSSGKTSNSLKKFTQNEGVEVQLVEMTRKITPFKDIKALWQLFVLFRKEKPFIVHTHTPKAGTLGMIAARLAGVPHRLHTIAGLPLLETTGFKRRVLNFVEKITYASATKVYPNSFGLKEIVLQQRFTENKKLKVIANGSSNGINTSHFNANNVKQEEAERLKRKLQIEKAHFVFVFIGRLVKDKGINELVSSFLLINKSHPNTRLLLVGSFEEDLDPLMDITVEAIKTHSHILGVGWQDDVRPFLKIANGLVFPSYREGFPNVVMQSAAMELPSIVTNINGCNEIIIEGENGLIVPPKDSTALQLAMEKILSTPENELKKMGENARKSIVERFEQRIVWDALLKEYKSLENDAV
nr:glycosyltransferase family 4 protein [Allomuricauda sp.]